MQWWQTNLVPQNGIHMNIKDAVIILGKKNAGSCMSWPYYSTLALKKTCKQRLL